MEEYSQYVSVELPQNFNVIKEDPCDVENISTIANNTIFSHFMCIEEPLSSLRDALERRYGSDLQNYEFFLQDTLKLESYRTLSDQCVQAQGLVQIMLELRNDGHHQRINILDILKPNASELASFENSASLTDSSNSYAVDSSSSPNKADFLVSAKQADGNQVTRWVIDPHYKKLMEMNGIPSNPEFWTCPQVQMWLCWAAKHFGNDSIEPDLWEGVDGQRLVHLSHADFCHLVPHDHGDLLWTHLELLRKYRFVAVMQQISSGSTNSSSRQQPQLLGGGYGRVVTTGGTSGLIPNNILSGGNSYRQQRASEMIIPTPASLRTGSAAVGGQVQLWQFLLELLTDWKFREIIHWVSEDGEFKLNNPETVAQLWGQRKNKPAMNYEKLSRALRYYYDGDMIAKVHGKRFVYKFICDLKTLLGYSAGELHFLVNFCAAKHHNLKGNRRKHQHNLGLCLPSALDFSGSLTAGGSARTTDKDKLYLKQFELPPSTNYPLTMGEFSHGNQMLSDGNSPSL